jgi:microcystin-dependent protein
MSKITYINKSFINENPDVAAQNKVSAADMNEIKTVVNNNTPAGSIVLYGGSTAPTGWLICDGSAVSRTTYSSLFTAIGTTYGAGNGSTTFNLPNLKGKVPIGQDSNDTAFDTLGETGGEKAHTLLTSEMPSHKHNRIRLVVGNQFLGPAGGSNFNVAGLNLNIGKYPYTDETNTNVETSNTGGGQSHNNLQPYIVLNYIISY